jgi:ribosome-associated toxin RatA of RatAB toxin-antitoxin module
MAVEIDAETRKSFTVSKSPDESYALISNVADSAAHFPRVRSLTAREDNIYEWLLEGEKVRSKSFAAEYACRYFCDPERRTVRWTAVDGFGNSRITGSWVLSASGAGTKIEFYNSFVMTLDVPRLFKRVAAPIVKRINGKLIDNYLENIAKTLNGGDGQLRGSQS